MTSLPSSPLTLHLHKGLLYVESLPGLYSLVASKAAWEGLSPIAQWGVLAAVYHRLGIEPPAPQPRAARGDLN